MQPTLPLPALQIQNKVANDIAQANFTVGDLKRLPRESYRSSGRIGIAVTIFVPLCGPVWASERLGSTVLTLTEVALDGALWKLDEQKVDPDGSRRFFADYRDDDNILLSVTEEPHKTVAGETQRADARKAMNAVSIRP